MRELSSIRLQGLAGLTARDIKLFVDAGYHTVESVAYTYVSNDSMIRCHCQMTHGILFVAQ